MSAQCPHHHDQPDPGAAGEPRTAPQFWRSLEELAQTPEFEEYLHREFPAGASVWNDGVSRRNFLALMGGSIALATLSGCYRKPDERIVPYVIQPEQVVQGRPLIYATAMPFNGYGQGCLVEQNMGRPTKLEGNPRHPSTLGGTDVFMQSAPLQLCDPDRGAFGYPMYRGNVATWGDFARAIAGSEKLRVRILTQTVTSPTLAAQIQNLGKTHKQLKCHAWQPFNSDNARAGALAALGRDVQVLYDFSKARRILSLDCDFFTELPGKLRYALQWASGRRVKWKDADIDTHHVSSRSATGAAIPEPLPTPETMNRLYVAESTCTITGAKADHRLPVAATEIEPLARAIAARIAGEKARDAWVQAVAEDLMQHRGASLVIAGASQPPAVHALAHSINTALGNVGSTLQYAEPVEASPPLQLESLRELVSAMNAGEVDLLLMLGGNPVFDAPADLAFLDALNKVPLRIHLSQHPDETSYHCHWHLPESHFLETWSDIRGHDGTASVIQPLIAPLYSTKSAHEVLAMFSGAIESSGYDIVREHWRPVFGDAFEQRWIDSLHQGIISDTASPIVQVESKPLGELLSQSSTTQPAPALELQFRPDPGIWDGRFANVAWLQECPRPITKLTWDNAALISPRTARQHNLANEMVVRLEVPGHAIEMPVLIVPGHPDQTITVHCGYGREFAGRVAKGAGFNVYPLRTSSTLYAAPIVKLVATDRKHRLASTQLHQLLEGRDIVRSADVSNLHQPGKRHEKEPVHLNLYPQYPYRGYRWGMVIDQTACIGCNACVVACQSENNIPVVGKDQVLRGREMHWLRIDTYFHGEGEDLTQIAANAQAMFQPMLCQHCEQAPCEYVCPVYATTHSEEGINEMTYNRCVGTRYCSNNCPYKVRRFNFYQFNDPDPTLAIMRNPEVTVRTRGVMEKCTFCVQRVNRERTDKKIEWVRGNDGKTQLSMREIAPGMEDAVDPLPAATHQTACQQACPTEAIVFGDMNDANSYVHRLKNQEAYQPIHYSLLEELNTNPRTTYLSRLTNPNPHVGGAS